MPVDDLLKRYTFPSHWIGTGFMSEAPALAPRVVRFDAYELDRRSGELRKSGEPVGLQQQPLQVLSVLLEQPGEVVTRDELRRRLWPEDTFVDFEHGLNAAVKRLRDALGDSAESPRLIQTVPRRGYRFIAPVTIDGLNTPPGGSPRAAVPVPDSRAKRRWFLTAALAIAAGILFLYVSQASRSTAGERGRSVAPVDRPAPIRFEVPLPAGVTLRADLGVGGVSPDGRSLAFVASSADAPPELWVRSLDTGVLRPLPGTEFAGDPFWAPSGQQLGFFSGNRLKTVDLAGSPPRDICEVEDSNGGSWAPDDTIVFAPGSRSALFRVAAAGGQPAPLTSLDPLRRDITHRYPLVLPDGRHVLYLVWSGDSDRQGIMVATMDGREVGRLLPDQSPVGFASGYLLFIRRETLVAQPFDPQALRLSGEAFTVESPVGRTQRDASPFAASGNGALAFSHSREELRMLWVDRQGQRLAVIGEHAQFGDPVVSRDGRLVAFSHRDRARGIDNFRPVAARRCDRGPHAVDIRRGRGRVARLLTRRTDAAVPFEPQRLQRPLSQADRHGRTRGARLHFAAPQGSERLVAGRPDASVHPVRSPRLLGYLAAGRRPGVHATERRRQTRTAGCRPLLT